jgi:predicted flap endonuclease-1-like 5' DNA nuclease
MNSQIGLPLAVSTILAQNAAALAIDGWWIIVIFVVLVVVISLLMLGNRQEAAIPPAAAHEHNHAAPKPDRAAPQHEPAVPQHEPAAPQPTAVVETERAAAAEIPLKDDLVQIEGIGPKIAALLNTHGIHTFRQLADADLDELNRLLDQARLAFADPSSWPEQARLADLKDWDALSELQARLKGGR